MVPWSHGPMVTTSDDMMTSRYDELLGEEYSEEVVRVRSTDTDRTLMSAQASLAGEAHYIHRRKIELTPYHTECVDLANQSSTKRSKIWFKLCRVN